MDKIKVLNGLPLSAITSGYCKATRMSLEHAKELLYNSEVESYIGHEDTAKILSNIIGFTIPYNRATAVLNKDDEVLVCAYKGPRLPEGATTLPEGATFEFWYVVFK